MYLSVSQVGTFSRCPEQWRRRYIEKEVIPPGIAARVGTGVHKGAEVNWKEKVQTGRDEPLNVVQDAARDAYKKGLLDGVYIPPQEKGSAKKDMAEGVDVVTSLAEVFHRDMAPTIMPRYVEKKVEYQDPRLPVPFIGYIDLITEDLRLSDMKTAARSWSQAKADEDLQATGYWKFVQELLGQEPSSITFDVLVKNKTPKYQVIETTRQAADWDALVARCQTMLKMVEAGIFPPAETGSWICSPRFCGYWWTCPYIPKHKKISNT